MQVRCTQQRRRESGGGGVAGSSGGGADGGGDDGVTGARVTSADLEWIPQGDQEERFADDPIRPVHDDILVARLRPGQEIELEAWCEKGVGKTHAKWSPVCTASYRLLPEIRATPSATQPDAHATPPPTRVWDVPAGGDGATAAAAAASVARPRECNMCKAARTKTQGWDERVQLARVKDHFIFSVESTGSLPPEVLFTEAVKVLMQKSIDIAGLLNDAVAGQTAGPV
jgi:DNA-directed RNA polymerase I and III subunit RPAC1